MSSDVKIPAWAMKMAREHLDNYLYGKMSPDEAIAIALLAAERRGRKAGLEEAAEVAAEGIKMPGGDAWAKGYRCASADIEATVSAAIRSLGEKI